MHMPIRGPPWETLHRSLPAGSWQGFAPAGCHEPAFCSLLISSARRTPCLSTMTFIDTVLSHTRGAFAGTSRNVLVAGCIVLFHVLALWALQSGLLRRAAAVFVPVEIISAVVEPLRPAAVPPPPPQPPPTVTRQVVRIRTATPLPAPQLQAVPNPDPAPNAPTAVSAPPAPLPPITAPVTVSAAPAAATPSPPAPLRVDPPSSDAEYLQNPKPTYPPMSRRLGEQGTVSVRVLIGVDGNAQRAEIGTSSGFARLDQAALTTVLKWRYVPGKRAGVAEAMWFTVPIAFALE